MFLYVKLSDIQNFDSVSACAAQIFWFDNSIVMETWLLYAIEESKKNVTLINIYSGKLPLQMLVFDKSQDNHPKLIRYSAHVSVS